MAYISAGPIGGRWFYRIKENEGETIKENKDKKDEKTEITTIEPKHKSSALFSLISRSTLTSGKYFTVYKISKKYDYKTRTENDLRLYAAFQNAMDFYSFYIKNDVREFHEVIFGNSVQKPRFDIDISADKYSQLNLEISLSEYGSKLRSDMIIRIEKTLKEFDLPFDLENDIMICTSSDETKYSCHLIVCGFCHSSNLEAKFFYELVTRDTDPATDFVGLAKKSGFIDSAIYSDITSLRLLGSTKNYKRVKTYIRAMTHLGREVNFPEMSDLEIFEKSCITRIENQVRIPIILPKKPTFQRLKVEEKVLESAYLLILKALEIDETFFEVADGNDLGSLRSLRRLKPSFCAICKREHESEGAYFIVDPRFNVRYYCRRSPGRHLLVGTVDKPEELKTKEKADNETPGNGSDRNDENQASDSKIVKTSGPLKANKKEIKKSRYDQKIMDKNKTFSISGDQISQRLDIGELKVKDGDKNLELAIMYSGDAVIESKVNFIEKDIGINYKFEAKIDRKKKKEAEYLDKFWA